MKKGLIPVLLGQKPQGNRFSIAFHRMFQLSLERVEIPRMRQNWVSQSNKDFKRKKCFAKEDIASGLKERISCLLKWLRKLSTQVSRLKKVCN